MDNEHLINFLHNLGIATGIFIGQIIVIILIWQIFKVISKRISANAHTRIKPLSIKKLRLLTTRQIIHFIQFLLRILKYLITVIMCFITIPIIFSIFPETENLAHTIFDYILTPLRNIAHGTLRYLPNLFTIIIILVITKYVIRGIKFFTDKIAQEKLVLQGFHHEWAYPTFNIIRFLIYAFTIAMIFPYLPGSQSRVFQGVSVLVGIIFSIGSSNAIGNLVAGLVITYMRPFKIGDCIQIQEYTGFVVEKSVMVLRIKTHKNEYITFPNLQVLQASIINYNTSSDEDEEGLILNAEITFNYATSWRTIHEILIEAALKTGSVLHNPKPFVLQKALDDFYARYQINFYTKQIHKIPKIYTELFENIQDGFAARGLDLTAPHYELSMPVESRGEGPWVEYAANTKKKSPSEKIPADKSAG